MTNQKIKVELTPEQLLYIQDKLHAQLRADKDWIREAGKASGLGVAEVSEQWEQVQEKHKELELIFTAASE